MPPAELGAVEAHEAHTSGRVATEAWRGRVNAELDARVAERLAARDAMADRRRHWLDWQPGEFDTDAKPVQGSLFAKPDRMGTPDMFADQP